MCWAVEHNITILSLAYNSVSRHYDVKLSDRFLLSSPEMFSFVHVIILTHSITFFFFLIYFSDEF